MRAKQWNRARLGENINFRKFRENESKKTVVQSEIRRKYKF